MNLQTRRRFQNRVSCVFAPFENRVYEHARPNPAGVDSSARRKYGRRPQSQGEGAVAKKACRRVHWRGLDALKIASCIPGKSRASRRTAETTQGELAYTSSKGEASTRRRT